MTNVVISQALVQISCRSKTEVWGVDAAYNIYQYGTADNWVHWNESKRVGALKQVSAAFDGTVMGVNGTDDIFRYGSKDVWTQIPGKLKQVSVGSANSVWGVNAVNDIFQYNNSNNTWTNIPGKLKQISAASDGTVMGVDPSGFISRYEANNTWTQLPGHGPGPLPQPTTGTFTLVVVVSAHRIYALDPSDPSTNLYTWGTISDSDGSVRDGWVPLNQTTMTSFSVAADNATGEIKGGVTTLRDPYGPL